MIDDNGWLYYFGARAHFLLGKGEVKLLHPYFSYVGVMEKITNEC